MTGTDAERNVVAPGKCPFCHSHDIGATGKKLTVDSYWRCHGCGQVWNPARLPQQPSRPFDRYR